MADEIGLAVAIHVTQGWGFVIGDIEDAVTRPVAAFAFRVFIDPGFFARPGEGQDVAPAIRIEIIGVGQKEITVTLRRIIGLLFELRREADALFKFRPLPDEATGTDVIVAIVIKVGEVRAFGDEVVGERLFLKRDVRSTGGGDGENGQEEKFHEDEVGMEHPWRAASCKGASKRKKGEEPCCKSARTVCVLFAHDSPHLLCPALLKRTAFHRPDDPGP